jgi:hypothetical protein
LQTNQYSYYFLSQNNLYSKVITKKEVIKKALTQKENTSSLMSYFQFNKSDGEILDRVNTNHLSMGASASRSTSTAPVRG